MKQQSIPKTKILHVICASKEVEDHVNALIVGGGFPLVPENVAVVVSYVWRSPFWKRLNEVEFEVIDLAGGKTR